MEEKVVPRIGLISFKLADYIVRSQKPVERGSRNRT